MILKSMGDWWGLTTQDYLMTLKIAVNTVCMLCQRLIIYNGLFHSPTWPWNNQTVLFGGVLFSDTHMINNFFTKYLNTMTKILNFTLYKPEAFVVLVLTLYYSCTDFHPKTSSLYSNQSNCFSFSIVFTVGMFLTDFDDELRFITSKSFKRYD